MSLLSKLQELIGALKEDHNVIRFQELEALINQNVDLQKDYQTLLEYQKILVQKKEKKQEFHNEELRYNNQYEKVMNYYFMEEYLELVEVINNDLQLIKQIITDEINMNLDE